MNPVQIANPFIDTKTLEEAQEIAGFELNVPRAEDPYTVLNYRAVEGSMLEIIFRDRKGTEGYRIRKAVGEDDISGDYSEYATGEDDSPGRRDEGHSSRG